jgi:aspartyl-tRNA(Asn)/glutamyl-tRNA(Gln) amidotransferase subunit A
MSSDDVVLFLPIREIAGMLRRKEVSPTELAQISLKRLKKFGPEYNAVITITEKLAMRKANLAERELLAGKDRGLLHGIPYGAKDLLATAGGIPTTWGAAPLRTQKFDYDATVIQRLESAGAILAAKLSMVELAGGMGYRKPNASFTGPGINPWDTSRWSGGSSTGPGSAVAAGLVPFSIGSETWGSIMAPAANCGITGLRPTYGRVSRYGAMALSWTLDKLGPMGRTADDCGLILQAIAGVDPKDPSASSRLFQYTAVDDGRPFKLAVLKDVLRNLEDSVLENFQESLRVIGDRCSVTEIDLPDLPYEAAARTILNAEAASAFDVFIESGMSHELSAPDDRYGGYAKEVVLAKDYLRALRIRGLAARAVDDSLAGFDALVAPTRRNVASGLDEELRAAFRGVSSDVIGGMGNLIGLPGVSVPNGFGERGLPTAILFVGKAFEENTVLAIARHYQSLTDWHRRYPPIA